ncbi:MAG: ABC transporter permease [Provencibacterium sp.]|jgi:ABC-2 type transport system permease protein|nr:ABC transporter permease [Provencibacterium sp.]
MGRWTGRAAGVQKPAAYPKKLYRRLSVLLLLGYLAGVVLFYFLAGDQLHFRESRGNIELPAATGGTAELSAGITVEQRFLVKIDRLERLEIQWGTYYRPNAGTVLAELRDLQDGRTVLSGSFDAAAIPEGGLTALTAPSPIEGLYGRVLALRISSPDGKPGSSVSPLMSTAESVAEGELLIDGVPTGGVLCFRAHGSDYIWTGIHYWKLAAAGLLLLALLLLIIRQRSRRGKGSYILNAVLAVSRYRFLIRQLVSRDFKTKYKRSVLGMFWSFLNPLLMMCVQYFVFSTIFKSDIPNYAVYLLIGIVSFNFFSEACGMALGSIVGNASLITKVYMPKYIYPLTRVISSVVNLGISLIPLVIVSLATGVQFRKSAVLALYFLACLIIFSLGLGLLLASAMVFFRDMQFLWSVLSMLWMYATPIFYPESILPENLRGVLQINPLYHFLKSFRLCILGGISPEPMVYVQCMLMALGALIVGAVVFRKAQNRFALYL